MAHIATKALLVAIAIPLAGATAENLSPTMEFEGRTTTSAKSGAAQPVHLAIQSWGLIGQRGRNDTAQEIPLHGFYVAHLLSGDISTTIDGQTAKRLPGDYWTVKAGATMQVKVFGEYAMLETIVVTKD
jgi:hypothetical protein